MERLINRDAEDGLIATLLLHNEWIDRCDAQWFYTDFNRSVFSAAKGAYEEIKSADPLTVAAKMSKTDDDARELRLRLASLIERAETVDSIDPYAKLLEDLKHRRGVVAAAEILKQAAVDGEPFDKLDALSQAIKAPRRKDGFRDVVEVSRDALVALDRLRDGGVDLATGFTEVDHCLGGLRRGLLYTIGGKTSQGKTTVATNLILHNLWYNKTCKIIYDGFENIDQIAARLAAADAKMRLDWILKPWLVTPEQYAGVRAAMDGLSKYKDRLFIAYRYKVSQLRALCDEVKPDIILIDFLQRYAHTTELDKDGRLSYEVGRAVSEMQDLAIERKCAVVLFSQFKRFSEERRGKKPEIEDLKESGDIENYSDVIALLYWPWRDTLDPHKNPNEYEILLRKNKMGPCKDFMIHIDPETLKLSDWLTK